MSERRKHAQMKMTIIPDRYVLVDGGRMFRRGIQVQFHNALLDTEKIRQHLVAGYPDPPPHGEEWTDEKIRAHVEHALLHDPAVSRNYGVTYWRADDPKAQAKAEERALHPFQCAFCDFRGKNDVSLTMHQRRVHPDEVAKIADDMAASKAAMG